jgi:hypothetical protein
MGVVTAIAAGAVAAGAIASAVVKKNAADKAAKIQKKAIDQQQKILQNKLDPDALNKLAQTADTERAKNRIALQQTIDPELAQLRTAGKKALLEQASIPEEQKQSSQLASALFNETKTEDPRMAALKDSIINAAQNEINAGATLPPEFQAELVRSGLNTGSQSGIGITKNSIGGSVARALGLGGVQLQFQREQAAQNLAATGQSLINARTNILSSVFPKLRDLENERRVEAAQNFQLADQALPESGLSGQDVVNLKVAQQKGIANALGAKAQVRAGQKIAAGQETGAIIGASTSAIAGGLGGGYGNIMGSLFSKKPGVDTGGGSSLSQGQFPGEG